MIDIETYRSYCMSKPGVTESTPFDDVTLVFKVNKMFALCNIERYEYINLKCDPERAIELREQYPDIRPGFHMSKKHWNSVYLDGSLDDAMIYELIDHSYDLVFQSLTKKAQAEIKAI